MTKVNANSSAPETIEVPVWWHTKGRGMFRRDALPHDHPESTYNYIKNVLQLNPGDYGVLTEREQLVRDELSGLSREQLMNMVADLRMQVSAMERAGF